MTATPLKPNQRRQQQNRRRILDAALDLIAHEGLEAASLRKIAARSHYSPAALYEYFANKEAIIEVLSDEIDELLADYLRQATPNTGDKQLDPVGYLVEVGMRYVAFATEKPKEYYLMQSRNPLKPGATPRLNKGAFGILLAAVENLETHISPMSVDEFAYACWAFVHGLASLQNQLIHTLNLDFTGTQRAALTRFIEHGDTT